MGERMAMLTMTLLRNCSKFWWTFCYKKNVFVLFADCLGQIRNQAGEVIGAMADSETQKQAISLDIFSFA